MKDRAIVTELSDKVYLNDTPIRGQWVDSNGAPVNVEDAKAMRVGEVLTFAPDAPPTPMPTGQRDSL